jgi:hypothetical protein
MVCPRPSWKTGLFLTKMMDKEGLGDPSPGSEGNRGQSQFVVGAGIGMFRGSQSVHAEVSDTSPEASPRAGVPSCVTIRRREG